MALVMGEENSIVARRRSWPFDGGENGVDDLSCRSSGSGDGSLADVVFGHILGGYKTDHRLRGHGDRCSGSRIPRNTRSPIAHSKPSKAADNHVFAAGQRP